MIYKKFGQTNLNISALSFGAMRLPIRNTNADLGQSIELLKYAIDKGINFIDVATFYCHGLAEQAVGLAIAEISGKKIIASAKNSSHHYFEKDWNRQLVRSLKLLGKKRFNIYFLHYLDLKQWQEYFINNKIIDQVKEAQEKNLIQYLGFSSHDKPENVRYLIDSGFFDAIILPFNLLQREYEETLKYAYDRGLGVLVMNPLAGGILAKADLYVDDFYRQIGSRSLAELALNYVMSQPFIHSVLSGMESTEIIDENINTVHQKRLTKDEIQALNHVISEERAKIFQPCNGCSYCLPCTQGIDIPAILKIWNQFSILKSEDLFVGQYKALPVTAECCIQCGACMEKCPQRIPIPDIMKQAADQF